MGIYLDYKELPAVIEQRRSEGKKIVLTGGCFDIIHEGHQYLLREAKSLGDILVVNVVNDERIKKYKNDRRPINPELQRARVVSGLEGVDYSTVYHSVDLGPTIELALKIKPDVIVQGKRKWKQENIRRIREVLGYEVRLESIKRSRFRGSTTSIIERIVEKYKEKN